jgi:four helix bundle protein
MAKVDTFEDLWIWHEARQLVRQIYSDFVQETPASRDYAFRSQIQSAGLSIMNNIAEGFERSTDTEKARFLDIAKGSSGEVRSMYYVAEDIGYVSAELARQRRKKAAKISRGIATLSSHFRT